MAEPTLAEKMEAAEEALAAMGITDEEWTKRAVALFWSQAPFLPTAEAAPPPVEEKPAEPVLLVTSFLTSDDPATQERIKAVTAEVSAIQKGILCP